MSKTTGIQWTDATWNPWLGCKKVSAGCKNCYMFREQKQYGNDPTLIRRSKTKFNDPLKWQEPRLIFTCSWSDWFIEQADPWRAEAWEIIRQTPHHTYQILTKRPERIAECLPADWGPGYRNVWLGVSVEDQKTANVRIPILINVPAYIRFLSCEPLLGQVNLVKATPDLECGWDYINNYWEDSEPEEFVEECEAECDWINYGNDLVYNPKHAEYVCDRIRGAKYHTFRQMVDWVIVGGESGPAHRPMDLNWARDIVTLCRYMDVKVFVKQLGGWPDKQGNIDQFPEELKIRELPNE